MKPKPSHMIVVPAKLSAEIAGQIVGSIHGNWTGIMVAQSSKHRSRKEVLEHAINAEFGIFIVKSGQLILRVVAG